MLCQAAFCNQNSISLRASCCLWTAFLRPRFQLFLFPVGASHTIVFLGLNKQSIKVGVVVQLLRCLLHCFYMYALWVASYIGQRERELVHVPVHVCQRDMPFEVTCVAQRVKADLPFGLSCVGNTYSQPKDENLCCSQLNVLSVLLFLTLCIGQIP